jgi:ribosomal protein L29
LNSEGERMKASELRELSGDELQEKGEELVQEME